MSYDDVLKWSDNQNRIFDWLWYDDIMISMHEISDYNESLSFCLSITWQLSLQIWRKRKTDGIAGGFLFLQ